MAKIRQEINMLNATITATSVGFVVLTTNAYSGSVTYSFEIVGKVASGTCTVTCQRNGTSTNDATISLTETSYTRKRATLTPPAGVTKYRIGISGGTSPEIRAARILVFQDTGSESLQYTETQIEIGNQETQTSSTNVALTAPKYWYFDSSKWDSDMSFFAEVVGKRDTSTASNSTWILQEDDGSFGSWSDKVTIASAITSTTANDYRAAFTPTNGRNYRIVSRDSNTTNGGHVTYGAKIAAYKAWAQVGNSLTINGAGTASLAALSSSRVVFIDGSNDSLRVYDFDGTNWSQAGNSLGISNSGFPSLTALSSSRVAFIDGSNDSLRVYDFDGTNWSQVGNSLGISGVGAAPALAALSSSRVAFIDSTNDSLRVYDFDGTNWSQVGNSLGISNSGFPSLTALSSSRVAFIDDVNDSLRVYDFDGTNWSQVGNSLGISGVAVSVSLAALSSSRVAFIDSTNDSLRVYDFDGTNWSQVGDSIAISAVGNPAMAALSSSRVAFFDAFNDRLRTYELDLDSPIVKLEPQYLVINQNTTATGLADFDTLFDPAEWSGTANLYYHETNADSASSAVKLQTDPNGTPADLSSSTATGANRQRTAALAMPSTSETIDANVTTA